MEITKKDLIKYFGFETEREFNDYIKIALERPSPFDQIFKNRSEMEKQWYSNPVEIKFTKEKK